MCCQKSDDKAFSHSTKHRCHHYHIYSLPQASQAPGWLAALLERAAGVAPKPESEEYGIGSFVYRARRPFDPERLLGFMKARQSST
jgi:G3E family GTPase